MNHNRNVDARSRSGSDELDGFETALLDELRGHVARSAAASAAPSIAPARRSDRPSGLTARWTAVVAATAAASVAIIAAATAGGGTVTAGSDAGTAGDGTVVERDASIAAVAYTVDDTATGDIVVTVRELADSDGLQAALAEHGITAEVNYEPSSLGDLDTGADPLPPDAPAGAPFGSEPSSEFDAWIPVYTVKEDGADKFTEDLRAAEAMDPDDPAGCGAKTAPATLAESEGAWQLSIPGDSVLLGKKIYIGTNVDGDLTVGYPGTFPGAYCFVRTS